MSELRENIVEKVKALEAEISAEKRSMEKRLELVERGFLEQKRGFRRAVAESPITSCIAAFGSGAVLAIIAASVVMAP